VKQVVSVQLAPSSLNHAHQESTTAKKVRIFQVPVSIVKQENIARVLHYLLEPTLLLRLLKIFHPPVKLAFAMPATIALEVLTHLLRTWPDLEDMLVLLDGRLM